MKKMVIIFISLVIVGSLMLFSTTKKQNTEYLRIHIRANSNSEVDQNIKYQVKDEVVRALVPILADCETKTEAEAKVRENFCLIESVADSVLSKNGFSYKSKASLRNELFPTRVYDQIVFEEGFYDALILSLGSGEGDNWWCVVYPPLCFVEANPNHDRVEYKSKILQIIRKMLSKE